MTGDSAELADLLPLGYTFRDPHQDVQSAAEAILSSDWMRAFVQRHVEEAVAAFKAEAVAAIEAEAREYAQDDAGFHYADAARIVRNHPT